MSVPILASVFCETDYIHSRNMTMLTRHRFKREGIIKITDMLAEDIQHDSDLNEVLPPSLQVYVVLR